MIRCSRCIMPDTRPDTPFIDGVCAACIAYDKRKKIDWDERKKELCRILETAPKNGGGYDCIVPSSGGKDSHYQVLTLLDLGATPLVVTATTCHLTEIGRANIDNLSRYATTIEVSPNKNVRAKLNRLGLEMVGDISWPEHVSIFTTPFKIACDIGVPLIFYGENPQNQYGGPHGTEQAKEMTRRWVSEFGGFLGLRPSDLVGVEGITQQDMQDYMPPSTAQIATIGVTAYFLGQFLPWDSYENARMAIKAGMKFQMPSGANWWPWENLDNAQTGIHDFLMWRKYRYSRATAQLSVDVRSGKMSRDVALAYADALEDYFPVTYCSINVEEMLAMIGVTRRQLMAIADKFSC